MTNPKKCAIIQLRLFVFGVLNTIKHVAGKDKHLKNRDKPWKYAALAEEMLKIIAEDECFVHTADTVCTKHCCSKRSKA